MNRRTRNRRTPHPLEKLRGRISSSVGDAETPRSLMALGTLGFIIAHSHGAYQISDSDRSIDGYMFNKLLSNYLDRLENNIRLKKARGRKRSKGGGYDISKRNSDKANFLKLITNPKYTWKTFIQLMDMLGVENMKLTVETTIQGITATNSINLDLAADMQAMLETLENDLREMQEQQQSEPPWVDNTTDTDISKE